MTQFIFICYAQFTCLTCCLICQIFSKGLRVRSVSMTGSLFYFYCSMFLCSGILTTEKAPVTSYVIMGNLRGEEMDLLLSQMQ